MEHGQYLPRQHVHRRESLRDIATVARDHKHLHTQAGKRLDLVHDGLWLGAQGIPTRRRVPSGRVPPVSDGVKVACLSP
jgi:hypothetical protein